MSRRRVSSPSGTPPAVAAVNAARTGNHFGDTPRSWTSNA
jgi:hypothetical protein